MGRHMGVLLTDGLLFAAIGLALWRGGLPERLFAGVLAAMYILDRVGHAVFGAFPIDIENLHLVIDLAAVPAIAILSTKARRFWPIFALSLQLLSATAHVGRLIDSATMRIPITIASVVPYPLMCITLMAGTIAHARRMRRREFDPSWRRSSAPAKRTKE